MPNENYQTVSDILQGAKADIENALKDTPQAGQLSIALTSGIDNLINRVNFMGGRTTVVSTKQDFPPITDFLGEPIILREDIKMEDLSPTPDEKTLFISKVDALYNALPGMNPADVMNSYTIPEDLTVLRGVAYKAGVKDYETAPITTFFIDEIKKGISMNQANTQEQNKFEADLVQEKKSKKEKSKIELSQAEIDAVQADFANPGGTDETLKVDAANLEALGLGKSDVVAPPANGGENKVVTNTPKSTEKKV